MVFSELSAKYSGDGFDILQIIKVWGVRHWEKLLKHLDVGRHGVWESSQGSIGVCRDVGGVCRCVLLWDIVVDGVVIVRIDIRRVNRRCVVTRWYVCVLGGE